jgi:hypothetical protein
MQVHKSCLQTGSCRYSTLSQENPDAGFIGVTSATDEALMEALSSIGPISVAIDASANQFRHYSNGM